MAAKKILIVDDEPDVLLVLGKRLTSSGYDVVKAASGPEGLSKAKAERPDLIILDMMMPGMSGEEVAQELKTDRETRSIPILFLTALFTKRDETTKGHAVGGQTLFAKPYDPEELLAEVKRRLS
jgi:DNA-binding response OmpR family regulator